MTRPKITGYVRVTLTAPQIQVIEQALARMREAGSLTGHEPSLLERALIVVRREMTLGGIPHWDQPPPTGGCPADNGGS